MTLSDATTGNPDPIQTIQSNPLGTGSAPLRDSEFDYSVLEVNPFRETLDKLPENGETLQESFHLRRRASALHVFAGLWDTVDAIVHPVRTFNEMQDLTQTLIYLPDYCYHNSEVCQANALAGLFIAMDYVIRFENGQLHLSDKQMGIIEGAAIELVLPGPEDTVLDLARVPSKVDNISANTQHDAPAARVDEPDSGKIDDNGNVCRKDQCFAAGTLVQTEDGPKPIEEIHVGDFVLARHEHTFELGYFEVLDAFSRDAPLVLRLIVQSENREEEEIIVTQEHPFFTKDGWIPAEKLQPGSEIITADEHTSTVLSLQPLSETTFVYNLSVQDAHTYFVGQTQMWVHNTCECDGEDGEEGQLEGPSSFEPITIELNGADEIELPGWKRPPDVTEAEVTSFVDNMSEQGVRVELNAGDLPSGAESQFLPDAPGGPVLRFRDPIPRRIELIRGGGQANQYTALGPELYDQLRGEKKATYLPSHLSKPGNDTC